MAGLAHKFAFENSRITAQAISAVAMPDLAQHYKVLGTPHTVLNGARHLKGRLTETKLLAAILALAERPA